MKTLLQIEWMKVKSYRTFWILVALFVVAVVGINYIAFYSTSTFTANAGQLSMIAGTPYSFPDVWNTVAWMSSWLLYFPGFIIILMLSNEYTFKTHRQNIIDGLSRQQFVTTKLAVALILALFTTVIVFINAIIFGLAGGSSFTFDGIQMIGYFFISSWIYILFALLLAFLLRKAVLAIGVFFIFGLILDNVIPGLLRTKVFNGKPYGTYIMPLDVSDSLMPFPFFRNVSKMFLETPNLTICLIICLAWIVFYHWFTARKFRGEDL
jgi:ABC-2 type transport system permease protein